MNVTIVIPTKNAGQLLKSVLEAVTTQNTQKSYEVICIDSGSKDNTVEIIKSFPSVKLAEIKPQEFGHGKTRNYGASLGTGEFIVFITQDALPASNKWLDNLVDAVAADPLCAGGFGIHYPYENCNLFDKRDLSIHFKGFGQDNTYYWINDWNRYRNDEGYRHLLGFYSDNNSCMRRSIWEKIPYDDVNFAEDQFWARKIIELGYHKVFAAHAPVFHSHNYKVSSYFRRYYDEYKGLYNLHQYVILKSPLLIPAAIIKHVVSDVKYIRECRSELSVKERIYWFFYSIGRNSGRYFGGWLGGNYHKYSPRKQARLDRWISQQYKQIKQ